MSSLVLSLYRCDIYIGLTSTTFKDRLRVHNQGVKHRDYSGKCVLSKQIWTLKDSGKNYSINWGIIERVHGRLIAGECRLCVTEKLHIIQHPDPKRLPNSNSDIKCMYQQKYKLAVLSIQGRGSKHRRFGRKWPKTAQNHMPPHAMYFDPKMAKAAETRIFPNKTLPFNDSKQLSPVSDQFLDKSDVQFGGKCPKT